jgi:hypothetical protein
MALNRAPLIPAQAGIQHYDDEATLGPSFRGDERMNLIIAR